MGKRLIQQRRGRGTGTYKSPGHRFIGPAKHPLSEGDSTVMDILHCAGHSAPLMAVSCESGEIALQIAPKGVAIGDNLSDGVSGSVKRLGDLAEGTLVYNIEARPGDGGKFVRSSGAFARVVSKDGNIVRVKLPSRVEKTFLADCRAAIGVVAGNGRTEKPFMKAGNRFHRMKARNKLYPRVCGISMNAVDHPFGGSCSHVKGRPTQAPRNAPPGRKVGKIAPKRTGRKR